MPLVLFLILFPVGHNKELTCPGFLSEDVEDELVREEVILSPVPSMLKLQIVSKPIDLSVAKVRCQLESARSYVLI